MLRYKKEGQKRESDAISISLKLLRFTYNCGHTSLPFRTKVKIKMPFGPCRHEIIGPRGMKLDALKIECLKCLE